MVKAFGWAFPAAAGAAIAGIVFAADLRPAVAHGIATGTAIAVLQTYLSTAALRWSWNSRAFWFVWGGGILFRLVVFAATAFVVFRFTQLSFVATMASLVVSTTLFLVVESAACLKG